MSINANDEIWEPLMAMIQEEKCTLVIGPDISVNEEGNSLMELLKAHLEANSKNDKGYNFFYKDDEFFLFNDDGKAKLFTNIKIKKFFDELKPPAVLQKIAEIPFHLIISVSPDHMLKGILDENKIDYSFDFYNKEKNPSPITAPSKDQPLLYNLFGDYTVDGSMVLTYDHLFEYLSKIFGDFKLPAELMSAVEASETVLFIGFRFERWYFRLLLRLLNLQVKLLKGASQISQSEESVYTFYKDEFKMDFVDANEIEIIEFLHQQFGAKNLLRAKQLPKVPDNEIFISYAWGGESEQIVDGLYATMIEKGYKVIRDKVDLGYKGNIKQFMDTIGEGKYVIVVISDKYLTSPNCMYEMLEIQKKENMYKRIFPIVLADADIYNDINRLKYTAYWQEESIKLETQIRALPSLEANKGAYESLDRYGEIKRVIDGVTTFLHDLNALTPDMHKGSNFSELIKALDQQMQDDSKK